MMIIMAALLHLGQLECTFFRDLYSRGHWGDAQKRVGTLWANSGDSDPGQNPIQKQERE